MAKDNPWAGIGALDQKLYQQQPKKALPPTPSRPAAKRTHDRKETAETSKTPSVREAKTQEGRDDGTTSSRHDVNYRAWRDIIENTETHNSSLRLTAAENFAVEDVITELKRHLKVKTSLNELARLGLLYLIHDFKTHRENSLLYKVKKS
jgi:hypothetical protein